MSSHTAPRTLRVPVSVSLRFLVAADRGGDVPDLSRDLGADALSRYLRGLLRRARLTVAEHDAARDVRLRTIGGNGLAEALSAARHLLVASTAAPAEQPRHAQAVRLAARLVAARTGGPIVDLDALRPLSPRAGPPWEPDRFSLDQEWVGIFLSGEAPGRARADTYGLHRFGLPELTVRDVLYGDLHTVADRMMEEARRLHAGLAGRLACGAREVTVPPGLVPVGAACPGCGTALKLPPPAGR